MLASPISPQKPPFSSPSYTGSVRRLATHSPSPSRTNMSDIVNTQQQHLTPSLSMIRKSLRFSHAQRIEDFLETHDSDGEDGTFYEDFLRSHPEPQDFIAEDVEDLAFQDRLEALYSFFEDSALPGSVGVNIRDHALSMDEVPDFEGYHRGTVNWYTMLMYKRLEDLGGPGTISHRAQPSTSAAPPTPQKSAPKRVLDIGCGIYATWILHMLASEGWEKTSFVGLDIAPVLIIPDLVLPYSQASRVSFVQSNFLQTLPFLDAKFDFVRIAYCSRSVPEDLWQRLLEEVTRVATPGATVEITDMNFPYRLLGGLYQLPASPHLPDSRELIGEAFGLLDKRFLNQHPLSVIPPVLAINFSRVGRPILFEESLGSSPDASLSAEKEDSGRILAQLMAEYLRGLPVKLGKELAVEKISTGQTLPATLTELHRSQTMPEKGVFRRSGAHDGSRPNAHRSTLLRPSKPAVATVAAAFTNEKIPSPSAEAEAAAELQREEWLREKAKLRIQTDVMTTCCEWADDLTRRAQISSLVVDKWGWDCTMDQNMEGSLITMIPTLDANLIEYQRRYKSSLRKEMDPDLELRMGQLSLAKREALAELKLVRKRLGRGRGPEAELACLGQMEFAEWVAVV